MEPSASSFSSLRRSARMAALVAALGAACLTAGAAACSDAAAVFVADTAAPAELLGRWATAPEALMPNGSHVYSLEFGRDGRFVVEWRAFGVYPGQRAGDLAAYSRSYGGYRVDGDRLTMLVDRVVTWDRFYGADSKETETRPQPATRMYDDARFRVGGDTLVLDYTSYPADAPEPTRMTFRRAQ